MDIAEFVAARADEQEAAALRDRDSKLRMRFVDADEDSRDLIDLFGVDRALREVEADRRLLAELDGNQQDSRSYDAGLEFAIAVRAEAWSDHPDYDERWKP